jgi:hypothetical protein
MALGLILAFGRNLAFGCILALGLGMAFGRNLVFGYITAFGHHYLVDCHSSPLLYVFVLFGSSILADCWINSFIDWALWLHSSCNRLTAACGLIGFAVSFIGNFVVLGGISGFGVLGLVIINGLDGHIGPNGIIGLVGCCNISFVSHVGCIGLINFIGLDSLINLVNISFVGRARID